MVNFEFFQSINGIHNNQTIFITSVCERWYVDIISYAKPHKKYQTAQANLTMADTGPFGTGRLDILLVLCIVKYRLDAAAIFSSNFACREEKSIFYARWKFLGPNISKTLLTDFLLILFIWHWWRFCHKDGCKHCYLHIQNDKVFCQFSSSDPQCKFLCKFNV